MGEGIRSGVDRLERGSPDLTEWAPREEVALACHLPGLFRCKVIRAEVLLDLLCHRAYSCRTRSEDKVLGIGGYKDTLYSMLYLGGLSFTGLHRDSEAAVVILEGSKTAVCRKFVFHRTVIIDVVERW